MSDCFWTDLVRVAQNCGGDPPAPEGPIFVAAGYGVFMPAGTHWFIGGISPLDGSTRIPDWFPSNIVNGSRVSARYQISGAHFATLNTGDVVVLDGLTREDVDVAFTTNSDGGINVGEWPDMSWEELPHPGGSYWIIELLPPSPYPPPPGELEYPEYDDEGNPVYPENFWWPAHVYVAYRVTDE